MTTSQGFITCALNSPRYVALAANLAATLKAGDYRARVALVTNLPESDYWYMFDEVIQIDETNPFRAKTDLYRLTPFKETFFVDADTVFVHHAHDVNELFSRVSGVDLSFPVLGVFPPSNPAPLSWVRFPEFAMWAALESHYPAIYSGCFYFRKGNKARAFFKAAKDVYGTYPACGKIGPFHPDEPYFSLTAARKGYTFGELNGIIYKADSPSCNERGAISHPFITMPGRPTKEHVRLYNAIALKAAEKGYPVTRFQK